MLPSEREQGSKGCPEGAVIFIWDPESSTAGNPVCYTQAFVPQTGEDESSVRPEQSWQRHNGNFLGKPLGSPAGEKTRLPCSGKMSALQSPLSFCWGMKQSPVGILRKHERESRTASSFVASEQGAGAGICV